MANARQIFIENLKYYRKQNNMRQLDLAIEIGKSSNYINSVENGKYFPSPETIDRIADVLKIDVQKLFDSSIDVKPEKDYLVKEIFNRIENQIKLLIEQSLAETSKTEQKDALAKEIFSKIEVQITELIEKQLETL